MQQPQGYPGPPVRESSEYLYGYRDIIRMLPHRYPFLLVDRILSLDLEKDEIIGVKNVTINEYFFQGHFPPAAPIMPGVLILEALAQAGGILIYQKGYQNQVPVIMSAEAKFRHPVRPGDVLTLTCRGKHFSSKGGKVLATASVGNKISVEAEIGFALINEQMI